MSLCDGAGGSITFGVSSYAGRLVSIGGLRRYREIIDDTALGDTAERACPGVLQKNDTVEVTAIYRPGTTPAIPTFDDPELITIQLPTIGVETTGAQITGTGFISEHTSAPIEHGSNFIATFSIKFDGITTPLAENAGT